MRNDSSCGSTIGPMLSAKLGLRTVGKVYTYILKLKENEGKQERHFTLGGFIQGEKCCRHFLY